MPPLPANLDTARVHAFDQAGQTFELVPFQGTTTEAVAELWKASDPFDGATVSDYDPTPFDKHM